MYEETGEAFCSPNCEDLDPCGPEEICVINTVNCIRSPCPGVLSCEEGNGLKIYLVLYNPTLACYSNKGIHVCVHTLQCCSPHYCYSGRSTTLGSFQSVIDGSLMCVTYLLTDVCYLLLLELGAYFSYFRYLSRRNDMG